MLTSSLITLYLVIRVNFFSCICRGVMCIWTLVSTVLFIVNMNYKTFYVITKAAEILKVIILLKSGPEILYNLVFNILRL